MRQNPRRKKAKYNGSPYVLFADGSLMKYQSDFCEREKMINGALSDEGFILMLQPKVNMVSGRIIGAEDLTRMIGEDGSVIKPQEFIGCRRSHVQCKAKRQAKMLLL